MGTPATSELHSPLTATVCALGLLNEMWMGRFRFEEFERRRTYSDDILEYEPKNKLIPKEIATDAVPTMKRATKTDIARRTSSDCAIARGGSQHATFLFTPRTPSAAFPALLLLL
jgi:hypothetical protein